MYRKSLERKEHNINISLFKPEPNASIWGCLTGKHKWSDFLKPQINGQAYKVDLNLQTVGKDKKLPRKRKSCIRQRQVIESREKKMLHKGVINASGKSSTNIYVKNLISNSTFATNIPTKRTQISRTISCPKETAKGSLPIYKVKTPKPEGPSSMQLKFRDNVLHLYNVKGMKHKKVFLQGVPTSKIFPYFINNNKHSCRPIFLNPLKIEKSKSVAHKEDEPSNIDTKYKQEPSPKLKNNAEEKLVIPQLISKIQSMEQQIQCLENTTKKIDEEVASGRNLTIGQNQNCVKNAPTKRKSFVISYRRSHVLPQKNSPLMRKKLKDNKFLKKELSKTITKIKNYENFRESKNKDKSKFNVGDQKDDKFRFFDDIIAENLKILLKNKSKNKVITHGKLKAKTTTNQYNKQDVPELFQIDVTSEKVEFNSELERSSCNKTKELLESENIIINREQREESFKINTFSHSTEDYNHLTNPGTNYINILRSTLELKNVKGKPQELPNQNKVNSILLDQNEFLNFSNQCVSVDPCLDPKRNRMDTNKSCLPYCKPNSYEDGKGEKKSVSLTNGMVQDMVPAKDSKINHHHSECKERSKPDTKFNITIFINEQDNDSKPSSHNNDQYENLSLIENRVYSTEMAANKVTEIRKSQNIKADAIEKNYQPIKLKPIEETIPKACYKPVSCPGELDKLKMKYQSLNTNNEICNSFLVLPPVAKSENPIPDPLSKPYLSRKQRKLIQKKNEMNHQIRFKFSDSLKGQHFDSNRQENDNQGNMFPSFKTFHANIDKYREGLPTGIDKKVNNLTKNNFEINPISKFNNNINNDFRCGDTERNAEPMSFVNCFQTSVNNTMTQKPFNSYNEKQMKNFVRTHEDDQKSFYCHENIFPNITPLKCAENNLPLVKTNFRKNNPNNLNTEKYQLLSETLNYENTSKIDRHKKQVNVSLEDLKNESICKQFMKRAGQQMNTYSEQKWVNAGHCNLKLFSSIIGNNKKMKENFECTKEFEGSKTSYTMSGCSSVEKEDKTAILVNKNNRNTIKIRISKYIDQRTTKQTNESNYEKNKEHPIELEKSTAHENLQNLTLPIKKCQAELTINNKEGKDLKAYFSRLSNSHTSNGKSGVDSGYDSSKNKQDDIFEEIVTCIKEMTINQMVDKSKNDKDIEEEVINIKKVNSTKKVGTTVKNKTILEPKASDSPNSEDVIQSKVELSKKKCDYCLNCQGKLSESSGATNSNCENDSCLIDNSQKSLLLSNSKHEEINKLDTEIIVNDKYIIKGGSLNLINPLLTSPSELGLKLEETNSVEQSIPTNTKAIFECSKEDDQSLFVQSRCNEPITRPIVISCSNLRLGGNKNLIKLNSPSQLKNISLEAVRFYNLQPIINNASIYKHNNDTLYVLNNEETNAFVSSPSNNGVIGREKCPTNIFNSLKEKHSNEKSYLNFKSKEFPIKGISNTNYKKFKNINFLLSNIYDVDQLMQSREGSAGKSISSPSVLKSSKMKNKSFARLSHSDSIVCFSKVLSCSSSHSTLHSNDFLFDSSIYTINNKYRHFLEELKQKVEKMKDSSEQCMGQCQMMMELYDNVCQFQKISSEMMNCFMKVNKTISGNMLEKQSHSESFIKHILSDVETNYKDM